jgi:hypothetical protein
VSREPGLGAKEEGPNAGSDEVPPRAHGFRCLGQYEPSMEVLREQYGDCGVSERDLRKVQRQQTGEAAGRQASMSSGGAVLRIVETEWNAWEPWH